ncbi:PTS sugar transporter subunit IIB [Clostridium sp. OS1-26]|uniref:PTS sugar transporter subunit IIB n=1 Tax=Clostridium sp. OS1-26 TaxID=3070681 RepID=UPI0027E1F3DD|nr:PTS sugar transporter subunit IIB [Clostridium sp. OS1-26]WML34843.1 PTS sugar transporter subunit IIB [Clostridium sp. OS1-26]
MKILLMCAAGMSTSLLVTKMEAYAKQAGYNGVVIKAEPVEDLDRNVDNYDVFLLGPQVKYREKWVKEIVEAKGKRYVCIPPQVYGMVDGKKTFELAVSILNQ